MAREILLRLALKNFERARDLAHQVADKAQRTVAAAKDAADKAKRATEASKRSVASTAGGGAVAAGAGVAAGARAGLGDRVERGLRGINEARERVGQVAGIAAGGVGIADAAALLRMGGRAFGPAGLVLTVLAPFVEELIKWHKEKLEAELQDRARAIFAELERERQQSDYSRRFAEDPAFAWAQAKQALEETLAEEARRGKRVERTTGDLVADFGL